ncbi:hypothetical protein K435DRAFT_864605 [Dendrothele bispora CBS 962.96]|uniref:Uncharacterized protein n=1 Tax=Dendrothele bispora (strain CBS 962.96) TaxID=1314807 RepID=A0A4S8LLL0_DENBC|nr:hypothetical protein K435DRAFT_864605 [Dendrothele bispora CBS 962.96]
MSAFNYQPGSVSNRLFDLRRESGGLYDYLVDLLNKQMGKSFFANAEVGKDFTRSVKGRGMYSFVDKESQERPFTTNVFGEIMGAKYGTLLTARYNHYPGEDRHNPLPLTDSSKPTKAVIALGCPSNATEPLRNLWYNQLCAAVELRKYDLQWEQEVANAVTAKGQQAESFVVKEFVKNTDYPSVFDVEPNCMILTGPAMYTTPPQGSSNTLTSSNKSAPSVRDRMKRRKLNEGGFVVTDGGSSASEVSPQSSSVQTTASSVSLGSKVYPTKEDVFVGATYNPNLQHDFGGKAFAFNNARLVQPDFRDVTQQLIGPWDFYEKLKPGTLVMANIDVAVFLVHGRKTYHANILSLRVLGESGVSVERPQVFVPPVHTAVGPSADSFNNFTLPPFVADVAHDASPSVTSSSVTTAPGHKDSLSSKRKSSSGSSSSTLDDAVDTPIPSSKSVDVNMIDSPTVLAQKTSNSTFDVSTTDNQSDAKHSSRKEKNSKEKNSKAKEKQ